MGSILSIQGLFDRRGVAEGAQMRGPFRWGWTLGLLMCLVGCGDRKHPAELQGTWRMQVPGGLASQLGLLPGGVPALSMTLAPNGELTMGAAGRQRNGRWEVEGQNLKFSGAPDGGAPSSPAAEQSVPFRLEGGGKTLRMTRNNQEVTWTKE